jgi:hypothetical protein
MRSPRVRFTVRWMMVAVAVLAVLFSVAERHFRFQRLGDYHFRKQFVDVGCFGMMVTRDGEKTVWVEASTATPITLAEARWHGALHEKYQKAARYPWVSVEPDSPKPRSTSPWE